MEHTLEQENTIRTGAQAGRSGDDGSLLGETAEAIKEGAAEALKGTAADFAEAGKETGAERIGRLGRAVHGAANEIGKELPQAAEYVHTAGEGLENAAAHLRDHSVEDLFESFNRFARRQPVAAFAGAILAGFVLSRFLKSSQ
jgi:hypothetical protein